MDQRGTLGGELPRGWLRWLLRAPIWLYRWKLGWLLGRRFLLLTHRGRKTGLPRHTVLEVARYEPATGVFTVASAWGERAQWLRNVTAHAEVAITVGTRRRRAVAHRLDRRAAEAALRDYAARHPRAMRRLARMMLGVPMAEHGEAFATLAEAVPVVELRPIRGRDADAGSWRPGSGSSRR